MPRRRYASSTAIVSSSYSAKRLSNFSLSLTSRARARYLAFAFCLVTLDNSTTSGFAFPFTPPSVPSASGNSSWNGHALKDSSCSMHRGNPSTRMPFDFGSS
ncbi:hypothetical protein DM02DRAFT_665204 [Periconia macrospinosa]|uniref:Uncharacterized protein n=1 Tax=Periconia macrospinosa TaxID=97972 RepID=A0A2V1CX81_9PLEO|nr:hypothetical protein DM02DRAFT_665204 [Periconia macrospinosa]